MKRKFQAGLTSVMLPIFIQDTTSTTGGGLSGVTFASSGLVLEYRRAGQSTWTSTTPVTKTLGTYVSGGIVADGALAGAYEVDFPNAAFAAGARFVALRVRGVANMLPVLIEIELDAVNYQDGTRFGLAALPNVASGSAGALITSGVGTAQLSTASGLVRVDGDGFGNTFFIPSFATANQIPVLQHGTAQAGGASTITLNATASNTSGWYTGTTVIVNGGTGAGQSRTISAYNGTTKVATVSTPWTDEPDNSSTYVIVPTSSGGGGGSGDASQATLLQVKAKTDLINAGSISYSGPVDPTGNIRGPIIIGDDYLAANNRAFKWTIPAIAGITPGTAVSRFAGRHATGLPYTWNVTGTVTDIGGGFWELSHDMTRTASGALIPGGYDWSVEITAAGGTEITPVRSGKNTTAAAKFS